MLDKFKTRLLLYNGDIIFQNTFDTTSFNLLESFDFK